MVGETCILLYSSPRCSTDEKTIRLPPIATLPLPPRGRSLTFAAAAQLGRETDNQVIPSQFPAKWKRSTRLFLLAAALLGLSGTANLCLVLNSAG